ncbi:hypothetical protein IFM89_010561 [Coptis chinensis]|uniref:FCP1 homology domain-containing protein n=1 Tax=Coptis chinensis TaxID=261450 RepID=A0A835M5H4_9MAGN|nr:hypothetical protein IFM89_010561 [Coptis chinensis]
MGDFVRRSIALGLAVQNWRLFAKDGAANTTTLAEYHGELQDVVHNTAEHDFMTLADGVNMLLQNPDNIVHPPEDAANFDNLSPQQFVGTTSVDHLEPTTTTHSTVNALVEIEDTTVEEDLDVNTTDGKVGKQRYTSKRRNCSIPIVNELHSDRDKCTTSGELTAHYWSQYEEDQRVRAIVSTVIVRRYGHGLELNLRSFSFLKHQGWLNDEVVSIYMELLRRWHLKEGQSQNKTLDSGKYTIITDTLIPLAFCWDQSHYTTTELHAVDNIDKPVILKELVKLWDKEDPNLPWERREYNESNTVMLDDSPYKALFNSAHTTIFPTSYDFQNENDNSLGLGGDIRMYLEGLSTSENVQKYIEQHPFGQQALTESDPSWPHYLQLINSRLHGPSDPGLEKLANHFYSYILL